VFETVLIANRGEIACRILRTLKKLAIHSVAVYSDVDAQAPHVLTADRAIHIGPATPAESYLSAERILAAAKLTGAQAIHPGYGFLSENAAFAEACERAGIVFIGPTPEQISEFGLKHRAREIARACAVPLLPGSDILRDAAHAVREAAAVGYPVMLKSSAGGGGIGMGRCSDETEIAKTFEQVSRLGKSFFKDGGVYLERFVERARHVEVQIFGDGQGSVVALGERDCSIQRRHQKIVEETPAPDLPGKIRNALREAAVRLGRAVSYRSAGTVEFIYDPDRQEFYFLEVNTRLQVEHCVTEAVTGLDLVEWMVRQAAGEKLPLDRVPEPSGHAIQVRLYAEDPGKNFQPCTGVLTEMTFPQGDDIRVDGWVAQGTEISPYYDPLLAKIIVHGQNRAAAVAGLRRALGSMKTAGIETNLEFLRQIADSPFFAAGDVNSQFLGKLSYQPATAEVLDPGTYTSVQDYPGRVGYWNIGVPPSGPMDDLSFRIANRLVGNDAGCAALECTVTGPTLRFNVDTMIALAGADMRADLDGVPVPPWTAVEVPRGALLTMRDVKEGGCRAYLAVRGGFDVPDYLGSKSTFALGQFGGHAGRTLRAGDVLHLGARGVDMRLRSATLPAGSIPTYPTNWRIGVLYGPHGAPDFFTAEDIASFFSTDWEVHYNSNRLGIRLNGPKPNWARLDGGEAGLHPSNIHDCEYAIGSINFTGDMPVILTVDGPSLGGFVCPATIAKAELWKVGQVKPGDTIRFVPMTFDKALAQEREQDELIKRLPWQPTATPHGVTAGISRQDPLPEPAVLEILPARPETSRPEVVYRAAGDKYVLIEYGPNVLDLDLRFRVHALMEHLAAQSIDGIGELSPGVRSLQVRYDGRILPRKRLIEMLASAENQLPPVDDMVVPTRIVRMPLAFDDRSCRDAVTRYMQSVRPDAPWLPSNIEFIRRINGLSDTDAVRDIVFNARYMVLGLGDVYLGAPCAVPIDPRHRLLTSKYNPARTFTPEGAVGIGGVYMCIYGMDSPGGYQLVGRTVPIWNKFLRNRDFAQGEPWLLRFFDQVQFYPVTEAELAEQRRAYAAGQFRLDIRQEQFVLREYHAFLASIGAECAAFGARQKEAFAEERARWEREIEASKSPAHAALSELLERVDGEEEALPSGAKSIVAHIAGNIWDVAVRRGDRVKKGDKLLIIESMKMEFTVTAPADGEVHHVACMRGRMVTAGQCLLVLRS